MKHVLLASEQRTFTRSRCAEMAELKGDLLNDKLAFQKEASEIITDLETNAKKVCVVHAGRIYSKIQLIKYTFNLLALSHALFVRKRPSRCRCTRSRFTKTTSGCVRSCWSSSKPTKHCRSARRRSRPSTRHGIHWEMLLLLCDDELHCSNCFGSRS